MYRLEEILAFLEVAHQEGLQTVYAPNEEQRSEFGFGRAHGILVTVMRIKTLLTEEEERRAEKERQRDLME